MRGVGISDEDHRVDVGLTHIRCFRQYCGSSTRWDASLLKSVVAAVCVIRLCASRSAVYGEAEQSDYQEYGEKGGDRHYRVEKLIGLRGVLHLLRRWRLPSRSILRYRALSRYGLPHGRVLILHLPLSLRRALTLDKALRLTRACGGGSLRRSARGGGRLSCPRWIRWCAFRGRAACRLPLIWRGAGTRSAVRRSMTVLFILHSIKCLSLSTL